MVKEFKYDIAILRLLAIMIVVAFHGYGMTFVHFSDSVNKMYHNAYFHFNQTCLINVAMPLFVWISGYLFGMELTSSPPSISKLVTKKGKRILFPYFVFSLIFMLSTNSFAWEPFWQGGYWHLWFLPMLFWCFIFTWIIHKYCNTNSLYISLPLTILFFIAIFIPFELPSIIGLNSVKNWYCWFYLGYVTFNYDNQIMIFMKRSHIIWILAGIFIRIQFLSPTLYEDYTIQKIVASLCSIYVLWYVARSISWKNYKFTDVLLALSACSFGLYIFHNWIEMHLLSNSAQSILPIEDFASKHIILFPILFVGIAFAISLGLTYIIQNNRYGRKLL